MSPGGSAPLRPTSRCSDPPEPPTLGGSESRLACCVRSVPQHVQALKARQRARISVGGGREGGGWEGEDPPSVRAALVSAGRGHPACETRGGVGGATSLARSEHRGPLERIALPGRGRGPSRRALGGERGATNAARHRGQRKKSQLRRSKGGAQAAGLGKTADSRQLTADSATRPAGSKSKVETRSS